MHSRVNDDGSRIGRHHYAGMGIISMATLLLELSLTRVLSVANWYHFGFLVISTALLGFGTAGVVLSLWTGLRERVPKDKALAGLSLAFGLVTIASFWVMQRIPFDPFDLLQDRKQVVYTLLYYAVLAAPFFCSGLAIALLLTRGSLEVNRLYAADLIGAGLGCAAIAFVMPALGGPGSVVFSATLGLLAAAVFGMSRARGLAILSAVIGVATLVFASMAERALPITVTPSKLHPLQPPGRSPIYTAWNALSRVDLYETPAMPDQGRPDPGFAIIVDAGASGTAVADLSIGVRNYLAHAPEYRPSGLAYLGKEHPSVLIIGSGAGREVLEGLYFGASSITAVEINPIINDIVTKRMRRAWGGLFEQPEVHLVTEDGRSFVRRSKDKYDAIISIQTMSTAALASGALSLSETYVLTRDAFEDYIDHLTPDGVLLVTRPQHQIPKLFATVREVFERRGLGSPAGHLLAFRGPLLPFGHRQFLTGLIFKKSPLTPADIEMASERLGVGRPYVGSESGPPEIFYSPTSSPENPFETQLARLANALDLREIYASSSQLLTPATDNRPFFNQNVRWTSLRPYQFRAVLTGGTKGDLELRPVAEITLLMLLVQAAGVAAVLILLPLASFDRKRLRVPRRWTFLVYFAALGLGFILIEIVLLQRFTLFLGQPIYTYAVVLGSLLLFTGGGSYAANRFRATPRRVLPWVLMALLAAIGMVLLLMPPILSLTLGLALGWRVAVAVALVAPLGFLLGIPFPTGLRIVVNEATPLVPWAWAVNGFFTVIGSVAAMILGMALGFAAVLLIAGGCYAAALVAIAGSGRAAGVTATPG
jgi:hypothetical protein